MHMFRHIYMNRLKASIRDREMIFWTFMFPIILGTFFVMAFSNLSSGEQFRAIPVAVIDNDDYRSNQPLRDTLHAVSIVMDADTELDMDTLAADDELFRLYEIDEARAIQALEDGALAGYILAGDQDGQDTRIIVASTGIRQTIIKIFVDEFLMTQSAVSSIIDQNPQAVPDLMQRVGQRIELLETVPASSADPNNVFIYFYALLAMTCLYGGFWGLREVMSIQANQSDLAARLNLAPVHKMRVFAYSIAAVLTVQFLSLVLLISYLSLIHGISFGDRVAFILLACLVGSLTGISFGVMIASISKASESIKNAILIGFSMLSSFVSGLMIIDIRYIVMRAFPPIRVLNPANLISDAFYALYYYESMQRYWISLGVQGVMIVTMILLTSIIMRRRRYASL